LKQVAADLKQTLARIRYLPHIDNLGKQADASLDILLRRITRVKPKFEDGISSVFDAIYEFKELVAMTARPDRYDTLISAIHFAPSYINDYPVELLYAEDQVGLPCFGSITGE
jgi:hypothetical protein